LEGVKKMAEDILVLGNISNVVKFYGLEDWRFYGESRLEQYFLADGIEEQGTSFAVGNWTKTA